MARHKKTEGSRVDQINAYFVPSDAPPEEWAEDEKEWPVEGIVEEDIDIFGNQHYQTQWEGWSREDGTNTTWEMSLPGDNDILQRWATGSSRKRLLEARQSQDIDMMKLLSYMPHALYTAESAVAFTEKKKRSQEPEMSWDPDELYSMHDPVSFKPMVVGQTEVRREAGNRKRRRSISESISNMDYTEREYGHSDLPETVSQVPLTLSKTSRPRGRPTKKQTCLTARATAQKEWNKSTRDTGSAAITIVNEVDDEACPTIGLSRDFVYMEMGFIVDDDVPKSDSEFLFGCDCEDGCLNPLTCQCVGDSDCTDEFGNITSPYTGKGEYAFTCPAEVIECNSKCSCRLRGCKNRVVQMPRKTPLEVFKTQNNGWGVRSVSDIPIGTVLGSYTGRIMTRKRHARLSNAIRDYSYDLDFRDDNADEFPERYSVSAYTAGNWTRWVNHSCDPNTDVYPAVINRLVNENIPHMVFVAKRHIAAHEELTIDYNPAARVDLGKKGKKKVEGEDECRCGTELCRGYI